jgi:hypothetical protein
LQQQPETVSDGRRERERERERGGGFCDKTKKSCILKRAIYLLAFDSNNKYYLHGNWKVREKAMHA